MSEPRKTKPDLSSMDDWAVPSGAPETGPFVDAFSARTVAGALFVALIMMPASIYMGLVAGQSLGGAAEWVTIILFTELARRSFTTLKKQEVFLLFYVASGIAGGGPLAVTIWNQYMRQAPETASVAGGIPLWVVPGANSPALLTRSLAHRDWWWTSDTGLLSPILLLLFGYVIGRLCGFGMGYLLFRLTSDRERLPYPFARVGAEGTTALAESTERTDGSGRSRESWRRRVFSVGACAGILFGAVYVLLPVVSGLFLVKPIMLLPIPFVDLTTSTEAILPGALVSISFNAVALLTGMLLPFRMVLGTFVAMVATNLVLTPLLARAGVFKHWRPGNSLLVNQMVLNFDFWMSVSVGLAVAVFLIGLWVIGRTLTQKRRDRPAPESEVASGETRRPSRERGDFPLPIAVLMFIGGTAALCLMCRRLVPDFPFWIVVLFGFVWTPINSYISARLIGLTGSGLSVPYLKETAVLTSHYARPDIWFAPLPLGDYGGGAQQFRALELTRTRFTSVIKAELLMLPIVFVCSFLYWWFLWKMNQIPSASFPFAARTWPIAARQACLVLTANSTESPLFLQALHPGIIAGAGAAGVGLYAVLAALGQPVVFFYGILGGIAMPTDGAINLLFGALLGRYYFQRRFGAETWGRYVPVVIAGFTCGMGMAGMVGVALSLAVNCVKEMPF